MEQPKNLIKGKRYKIETLYTESEGIFTGYQDAGGMYFMFNSGVVMVYSDDWKEITNIQEVE